MFHFTRNHRPSSTCAQRAKNLQKCFARFLQIFYFTCNQGLSVWSSILFSATLYGELKVYIIDCVYYTVSKGVNNGANRCRHRQR